MPTDDQDVDSSSDALIAVPHTRRRVLALVGKSGLVTMFFIVAGALTLYDLLAHQPATDRHWLLPAVLSGLAFALASVHLWILRASLGRPLAIFTDGIELGGTKVSWEKVASCRWVTHTPGMLQIQVGTHISTGRFFVSVPGLKRAGVEAALRRFGKWEDVAAS